MAKSDGFERLAYIAVSFGQGSEVEDVTVRELLSWFGAKYRGIDANGEIRSALFENDLRVEPDINEPSLDGTLEFKTGVILDEIEQEFFSNPRNFREGSKLTHVEAEIFNRLYAERLADCLAGWIDRNPMATENEVRAKAVALNELGFDELLKEDGPQVFTLPEPSYRIARKASHSSTGYQSGTPIAAESANALTIYNESRRQTLDRRQNEQQYRKPLFEAIGCFIYEFSQLEFYMRACCRQSS